MSRGPLQDFSGDITAGNTAQQVLAANGSRNYLLFINVSSADMWIDFDADAVIGQPSIKIVSGGSYEMNEPGFVPTDAVSVISATAGVEFTCKQG